MELLTEQLDLSRFLYLLSFDTKQLKHMNIQQIKQLQNDYMLIHTVFTSTYGKTFTKMYRNSVVGKCSALNGVIEKKLKS